MGTGGRLLSGTVGGLGASRTRRSTREVSRAFQRCSLGSAMPSVWAGLPVPRSRRAARTSIGGSPAAAPMSFVSVSSSVGGCRIRRRAQFRAAVGMRVDDAPLDSFAWAAGLFDAEGSVSLSDHRTHPGHKVIESAVTQGSTRDVPEELSRSLRLVKIGYVNGPYEQEGANELVYRWRLHRADDIRIVVHLLDPWLGAVKRLQARHALRIIDDQPVLPRGRPDLGSHKTHCVHGHEYATARVRLYVKRTPAGVQRRDSKQCLACLREYARARSARARAAVLDQRAM